MIIIIVVFFPLVAIGAYFVLKGLFGAPGFFGVIATAAIAVVILQNGNTLTNIGLKTAGGDVSVEVARVRDEIFAKAEEVQQLTEQSAAISAWVVSTANRLVGGGSRSLCRSPELSRTTIGGRSCLKLGTPSLMQSAGLNNRSMQSSEKLWHHLRILINRQDYWSFDGMRSNIISNWRDSTAQWIDTTGFLSRTQTSWNNLEPPYRARGCPVGRDCGTGIVSTV